MFVAAQAVNLVAGGVIVGFCTKYKGEACPSIGRCIEGVRIPRLPRAEAFLNVGHIARPEDKENLEALITDQSVPA